MANEQNLIPLADRPPRERKEICRKGAMATNKKRRERKLFREAIKEALAIKTESGQTIQEIGITEILNKYMQGDLKAFEIIRDTIGEKPSDKMQIEQDKPFEVKIIVKKDKK